jgi:hypothetical protein
MEIIMEEQDFIAAKMAIISKRLSRQLLQIERSGTIGTDVAETLSINGLIRMGGPRPEIGNPYNCWRLTEEGQRQLTTLPR